MDNYKKIEIRRDIYWFLWILQRLLDNNEYDELDSVVEACDNGDIFNYIYENYNVEVLEIPHKIDEDTINYLYSNIGFDKNEINRKYNVYKNGLVYLSVVAIEWIYNGFDHLYQ